MRKQDAVFLGQELLLDAWRSAARDAAAELSSCMAAILEHAAAHGADAAALRRAHNVSRTAIAALEAIALD